jgi:hypothetical protein
MLTQAGAAWLLSGVFVRFLEDNGLVDEGLLSDPGERREQASERQMRYFQRHPTDSDPDFSDRFVRYVFMRLSRPSPMKVLATQGLQSLQSASNASD